MTELVMQGGGGHAAVVADCLQDQGIRIYGYCALEQSPLLDLPYLGLHVRTVDGNLPCIVAIGDNQLRMKLARELKRSFVNAVHPTAVVSPKASMGSGCMVLHRTVVQTRTQLGDHVILNTGCQVDHDGRIDDFVHIGPGSVLCGNVHVGEGALLGAGSVVLPNLSVGKWAVIGAGSVVTRNIPDGAVAVGVPAKILRTR